MDREELQASTAWIISDSNCNWQQEFSIDGVSKSRHSCCCLLRGAAMWTEQCWLLCSSLALERTLLMFFRCSSRAGIAFRTTDWRSIEECCACRPRFTLLFLQMLYFNCFLLCMWKRLFHIFSENYMTVKCPVCLYAFPYWLDVFIFLFNYCPSVFVDILQR